jgi:hypothetical protein
MIAKIYLTLQLGAEGSISTKKVKDEKLVFDLEVELLEHRNFQILQQCLVSKTPHRFPFSVAFSYDLDRLVVLRCLLIVQKPNHSSAQLDHYYRL